MIKITRLLLTIGVSCFVVNNALAVQLDFNCLGLTLNGWKYKNGIAAEINSGGSNYRTYKPTVTHQQNGVLYISTKLDHIRSGKKDDHALVELWFSPHAQLNQARTKMQIQGHPKFDTELIAGAVAVINPGAAVTTEIVGKILNSLSSTIEAMGEHGGRAHFPSVVQHNINAISSCVHN